MTPVMQTNYGKGQGNCLTACVASLLDLPITAVPELCVDGEWFKKLNDFCKENGFALLYWKHAESIPMLVLNSYVILCMKLEGTDELHAVIGKTDLESVEARESGDAAWRWHAEMVHDPNGRYVPPFVGIDHYIFIGRQ